MGIDIRHGDWLELAPEIPDNSIDSVVVDAPYEQNFMNKKWDRTGIAFNVETWRQALRVLKPGGHLISFGGTRTHHRIWVAIEDAGFELRDTIMWNFSQGFPKSLDVSKAIDKELGLEREVVGRIRVKSGGTEYLNRSTKSHGYRPNDYQKGENVLDITAPASPEAQQYEGFGTALKPAYEPICLARKPLEKGLNVAQNVMKWGTGAINIDACRIPTDEVLSIGSNNRSKGVVNFGMKDNKSAQAQNPQGRFPTNFIHDGSEEVLALFPETKSGQPSGIKAGNNNKVFGQYAGGIPVTGIGDSGSAARFFYCAKATKSDRGEGNTHTTVKPTDLMRYLCRLVTPPKGTVLDFFAGSGSTGKAAYLEGFDCILIEKELEHVEIIRNRLEAVLAQPLLPF